MAYRRDTRLVAGVIVHIHLSVSVIIELTVSMIIKLAVSVIIELAVNVIIELAIRVTVRTWYSIRVVVRVVVMVVVRVVVRYELFRVVGRVHCWIRARVDRAGYLRLKENNCETIFLSNLTNCRFWQITQQHADCAAYCYSFNNVQCCNHFCSF